MKQRKLAVCGCVILASFVLSLLPTPTQAVPLDKEGNIKLGVRTYVTARIGSERTDMSIMYQPGSTVKERRSSGTFPSSPAGHLRQNRYFLEAEFDHDLRPLFKSGFGPFALLNELPLRFSSLKYHLVFRGEGDGLYDIGPKEYSTAAQFKTMEPVFATYPDIATARGLLRDRGVHRERLFQAYVEGQVGNLFMRVGRQILSWGETDAFRLLDNINPIDSSFGGFLISLDERRVPLDMVRSSYYFGSLGPFSEVFAEGYVAIDNKIGFIPGGADGSPWGLPGGGGGWNPVVSHFKFGPNRNIEDARGGGIFKFNAPLPAIGEATFGVAHYYTYFDTPGVQTFTRPEFPTGQNLPECDRAIPPPGQTGCTKVRAHLTAPRVQITGATSTFVIPARYARAIGLGGEPVIRTELAYFHGEPRFRQSQLDPFVYSAPILDGGFGQTPKCLGRVVDSADGPLCTGGRRTGDSWNFVLGVDMNQYLRWLNTQNSFFITTQFFYKHLNGAAKRDPIALSRHPETGKPTSFAKVTEGEVLPVDEYVQVIYDSPSQSNKVQESFVRHPSNQFLQTLLISTSYASGQILPGLVLFYDWSGAFVAAPFLTLSQDPFRFGISYNYLEASKLKGASGVSLLRDRDNVLFQFEYSL